MTIHRPSRFRRVAKWVGLGLCLVIAVCWVVSLQIEISYTRLRLQDRLYGFHIESGMLNFRYRKLVMPKIVRFLLQNPLNGPHSYWSHADADQNPFWNYGFSMPRRQKRQMTGWLMEDYFVPLWMPLAVASLVTAILWVDALPNTSFEAFQAVEMKNTEEEEVRELWGVIFCLSWSGAVWLQAFRSRDASAEGINPQ